MASVANPTHPGFLTANTVASSRTQEPPVSAQQQLSEQDLYDEAYQGLFCKALYDYAAQDASALSFRRGDIIEVLNRQPSGWWDGLLGDERGWFPSNYVTIISLEEAELAFSGSDYSNGDGTTQSDSDTGVLGLSENLMRGQAQNEEWLESEMHANNHLENFSSTALQGSQTNDFWEPNIMENGRIFYINSRTGQHSWDLPQETADEISDSELAGLSAQSAVRAATGAGMVFGVAAPANGTNGSHLDMAGNGVPRLTDEPEQWIRRLADDGQTYYVNKLTGEVMQTPPEASAFNGSHPSLESIIPSTTQRPRADSRNSVYSDNSDVHPLDHPRPSRSITSDRMQQQQTSTVQSSSVQRGLELTSEELIAKQLQRMLALPPPELVTDLASKTREAIQSIIDSVQGTINPFSGDQRMDDLIQAAVRCVRNLLYVSAANTNHMPSDLLGKETRDKSSSPLKPAQRRVTATLSRLVLSARAMHYDSGTLISETLNRIEADALELERAVSSFIVEVQRVQNDSRREGKVIKRLYGTFTTANIGVSLVGAGSAGSWKGFGWVSSHSEAHAPKVSLGEDAVAELTTMRAKIEGLCNPFIQALVSSDKNSDQIQQRVQEIITHTSHFLSFVTDINIARHVDVNGIRQAGSTMDAMYVQTLSRARALVRTFEVAAQAVYDDSSSLLLTTQSLPSPDTSFSSADRASSYNSLESITSSLRLNLLLIRDTLEALLSIGYEQAELAPGDYNGPIEWKMSGLNVTTSVPATTEGVSRDLPGVDIDDEEVDLGHAINRPIPPPKIPRVPLDSITESTQTLSGSANGSLEKNSTTDVSTLVSVSEGNEDDDVDTIDEDLNIYAKKPSRPIGTGKLIHLLGDDYADKLAAESQPWYLRANYNPSEILIEESDNSVKGGTLTALVEKLTAHDKVDLPYTRAFLMTYKDFMTLDELFDLLVQRFTIQPPENLTPKELEDWTKLKQHVIRTRVLNTLKTMIIEQYVLDKEDRYILDKMMAFVTRDDVVGMPAAMALKSLIERAQNDDSNVKSMISTNPMPAPTPIIPRFGKKLKLLDIDPLELARQLTIMESRMYQRIKPIEALKRAREQRMDAVDDIGVVIQTSNRIADWVAHSILSKEDSRKRAQIIKHLINVADRCRLLNNFSTMIAITSGLNTPPIRRLKRTWEQVNQRSISQFAACEVTIDNSKTFAKNRQLMASVTPPCVPFIGVFLSTLQFIVDGNADYLQPGNLVNFFKRQKASEVMDDIKRWQTRPYNLQPVPSILTFIQDSLNQFSNTDARASSDTFWQLSLEREPREREDEKMARLLQESGFL